MCFTSSIWVYRFKSLHYICVTKYAFVVFLAHFYMAAGAITQVSKIKGERESGLLRLLTTKQR